MIRSSTPPRCCWMLAAALAAGCGSYPSADIGSYTPEQEVGRASLEAALDTWKAGQPPEKITSRSPAVQPVDSKWSAGYKLKSYEIVGPVEGDPPLRFKVKQVLGSQSAEQEVEYYIICRDPLFVFRDIDYNKTTGM